MKEDIHIKSLLKIISEGIYEKQHILAMSLLCAVAGESIFLLGPPGTAKSLVARRLKLIFRGGKSFEYLMSRFSTPDEIFGPVSISLLKNEDKYERVVDGFLPTADVVFLDEIWKAGPSIQNALLTAINEKIFQNGRNIVRLPMKALIAASNELPVEDEGLEALWDRFLVRMVSNCIKSESTFFKMIKQKPLNTIEVPFDLQLTEETYSEWQVKIDDVSIPDDVCNVISYIRKFLKEEAKKEDVNEMDFYISDRRWKKCFHLMQASAFLNGRKTIDVTDIPLLFSCLWNKAETIPATIDIVSRSITAVIDFNIDKQTKEIEAALKKNSQTVAQTNRAADDEYKQVNYFYYQLRNHPNGKCLFFKPDYSHVEVHRSMDGILFYDQDKKAWIVHAIYTGTPYDYKTKAGAKSMKVKLTKCQGGIIINGTAYAFERKSAQDGLGLFDNPGIIPANVATVTLNIIQKDLRPKLAQLQDMFSKTKHLFLSDDDLTVVKKYMVNCDKRLNELQVKATNAESLI